jgi:hypothetical protein
MKLTSIAVNDVKIQPSIVSNNIPGTNLYWYSFNTADGAYKVESVGALTNFGGYVYGFANWDGYGWPAAISFKKVASNDFLPPKIETKTLIGCGSYEYMCTDSTKYDINDTVTQHDEGLSRIFLVIDTSAIDSQPWSYNYTLIDSSGASVDEITCSDSTYDFKLMVVDKTKPARAIINIVDLVDHVSADTLYYYPDTFTFTPNPINFGDVKPTITKIIDTIKLKNTKPEKLTIIYAMLASKLHTTPRKSSYKITKGEITSRKDVQQNDSLAFKISFTPKSQSLSTLILGAIE